MCDLRYGEADGDLSKKAAASETLMRVTAGERSGGGGALGWSAGNNCLEGRGRDAESICDSNCILGVAFLDFTRGVTSEHLDTKDRNSVMREPFASGQ